MNELEDNLNDYISGSISFLTYRENRAHYINNFVDSGYLPDDTIPLNAEEQQQIKDAVQQKIKQHAPLDESTYKIQNISSSQSSRQYIGLGVLVVIAILTWYFSTTISPTTPPTSSTENFKTDKTESEINKSMDQAFVINFLKMDKWNSDTLSEFLVKWQKLSRTEKKTAKQSQSFIRLKNSLRLRILEQQALQANKDKAAKRQENLLIWFASQLSISVN